MDDLLSFGASTTAKPPQGAAAPPSSTAPAFPTPFDDPFAMFAPAAPAHPASQAFPQTWAPAPAPGMSAPAPIASMHASSMAAPPAPASNEFDAWWEAIGGSPKPSMSSSFLVSARKASIDEGRTAAATGSSRGLTAGSTGARAAPAADPAGEWHAHDEDEAVDEDFEEMEREFDAAAHGQPPGARSRRGSIEARITGAVPSRRSSTSTGSAGALADAAASAVHSYDAPASGVAAEALTETREGIIWVRVTSALVLKRWKERWAVLKNGAISVWADRTSMMRGEEPLEHVVLTANMALSTMKIHTSGSQRIFYRHISELGEGAALATVGGRQSLAADEAGSQRVFKFGCDSQAEFERWSRSIRLSIEHLGQKEKARASAAMALDSATNASDLFRTAIASPKERRRRRSSVAAGTIEGGTVNIAITLLDGAVHHVVIASGATVKDVLVAFRRQLGLRADADFSLYVRQRTPDSRDVFACLPDVMPAEEAEALSIPENRALVYRRRMYLPALTGKEKADADAAKRRVEAESSIGSGGGTYAPEVPSDIDDVDVEADKAAALTDAAHYLSYIDAVYNVVHGNYLLPLQDCVILAGLQFISLKGRAKPEDAGSPDDRRTLEVFRSRLPEVISAQAIAEHKATSGKGVDDLLAAIRREYIRLSAALDEFGAQRVYIKRVRQLPEYGGIFFVGDLVRLVAPSDAHGSRSAPDTPAWAEALTTDKPHAPSAPKPLPILIGINALGVLIRPLPPYHSPSVTYNYGPTPPPSAGRVVALGSAPTPSETISQDGKPVPWQVHSVHYIEVWGVKKSRPTFTYRVREREARIIEITSQSFKEMASTLHMFVFALLAQREGKPRRTARAEASDYGSLAQATKRAAKEAQAEALAELPHGWTTIQDPVTGQTAYWNVHTKQTVFARPTA